MYIIHVTVLIDIASASGLYINEDTSVWDWEGGNYY